MPVLPVLHLASWQAVGLEEVLAAVKHKAGTKQLLEWHAKLEDLRIKVQNCTAMH